MSLSKSDRQALEASHALEATAKAIYYGRMTVLQWEPVQWTALPFAVRDAYLTLAKAVTFMETPKLLQFGTNGGRTIAPGLKATHGFDCYIGPPEAAK